MTSPIDIEALKALAERFNASAARFLEYATGDDNWANRAKEEADHRDAILALIAERAELVAQRDGLVEIVEEFVSLMDGATIDELDAAVAKGLAALSTITQATTTSGGGE